MRNVFLLISNYAIFITVAVLAAGIQSSLWLHLLGYLPAPYMLAPIIVYWTLYRSHYEAVLMTYMISLLAVGFSGAPLFISFINHLSIFAIVYLLKDRVLWSGPNSFMLGCFMSVLAMPPISFILSRLLESQPVNEFFFWNWLISPLFTALISYPFYMLFALMDRWTEKEPPLDTESEVL